MSANHPTLLSKEDVAKRVGRSPNTIKQHARIHGIGTKIGNTYVFTEADIAIFEYLKTQRGKGRLKNRNPTGATAQNEITIEVGHPEYYFDASGRPNTAGDDILDTIQIGTDFYRLIRPGTGNTIIVKPIILDEKETTE